MKYQLIAQSIDFWIWSPDTMIELQKLNFHVALKKLIKNFDKGFISTGQTLVSLLQTNKELEEKLEALFETVRKNSLIDFIEFMILRTSLDFILKNHEIEKDRVVFDESKKLARRQCCLRFQFNMFSLAFYMKFMFTQDNIYLSFEKLIEEFDKEFIASDHSLFALLQKNKELEEQLENHFETLKKDDLIEFLEYMNIHISLDIKLKQHELDQDRIMYNETKKMARRAHCMQFQFDMFTNAMYVKWLFSPANN